MDIRNCNHGLQSHKYFNVQIYKCNFQSALLAYMRTKISEVVQQAYMSGTKNIKMFIHIQYAFEGGMQKAGKCVFANIEKIDFKSKKIEYKFIEFEI